MPLVMARPETDNNTTLILPASAGSTASAVRKPSSVVLWAGAFIGVLVAYVIVSFQFWNLLALFDNYPGDWFGWVIYLGVSLLGGFTGYLITTVFYNRKVRKYNQALARANVVTA